MGGVTIRGEQATLAAGGPSTDREIPKPEEIKAQLRAILASPAFHGSKRCQQFLEYVCEKSLAGEAGALKERTVAIDVFGRQPQSELGEDTIVRVGAREVRKRLAQFYVSPEGVASRVKVDLPAGSYAPEFHYAVAMVEKDLAPPPVAPVVIEPAKKSRRKLRIGLAVAAVLAIVATIAVTVRTPHKDMVTRFWEPVFASKDALLVGVAHPLVYHPSLRAQKLSEANQPPTAIPTHRPLQVKPKDLDGTDLIPIPNQYVGFGDMVAANQITAMLASKGKDVRLRLANSISFADMKEVPVLLIGAVTNKWTMEFQQGWRYQFLYRPGSSSILIDTFDKPQDGKPQRQWSVPATNDVSAAEDFVLVCRLKNPSTGAFVVVLAGIKQWGTEAAGRLVSDPAQLSDALRGLPTGWEKKNLQVVFHVRVIGNTPAQPEVAASYVW